MHTRDGAGECAILSRMASDFYNNSVFWIEVQRIAPNPFQPRRDFDEDALQSLAESIRQYGVLQPLVVTRREVERGDGGISVEYELVAGERRLRASKIAGVTQVPVLIRSAQDSDKMKLELAIIENLQREDLNPIDRALAFKQLADTFNLKHIEIAQKVGRSREYVSNSLRLLALPEYLQHAVVAGEITEGHTRPLLMLVERPDAQKALFDEIGEKHLTVRETERIARGIATERARKQDLPPELASLERELTERLGTRVQIETREKGGKLHIDFFSPTDIQQLLSLIHAAGSAVQQSATPVQDEQHESGAEAHATRQPSPLAAFVMVQEVTTDTTAQQQEEQGAQQQHETQDAAEPESVEPHTDTGREQEDIYSVRNFVV